MKRSAFGRLKDAGLEKALLVLAQPKFERYGKIHEIHLDTAEKRVSAEIQLLGESTPLKIQEARYRVEQRGEDSILIIYGVKVSRTWVQHLIEDRLPEIAFKIPATVRALIA